MGAYRVLFVAGPGRSGSTVLGNILNEVEGCVHIGELHWLWSRLTADPADAQGACGCGRQVVSCEFWKAVLAEVVPRGRDVREFANTVAHAQLAVRNRNLPALMGPDSAARGDLEGYRAVLDRTYRAICHVSGADVVVDTSKVPGDAAALAGLRASSFLIRLVRDPRAVAFSWSQHKDYLDRRGLVGVMRQWNVRSWGADLVARKFPGQTMLLRYEDLVADPQRMMDRILFDVGVADRGHPMDGNVVQLHGNHTVSGNPDRTRTGPTTIVPDRRWETGLSRRTALMVVGLTAPLMHRYGYL